MIKLERCNSRRYSDAKLAKACLAQALCASSRVGAVASNGHPLGMNPPDETNK